MDILVIGSGGREHAIAWKIGRPGQTKIDFNNLWSTPGNYGTYLYGNNVDIKADEIMKLRDFALTNDIGLTIVGPEDPLSLGLTNEFKRVGLKIFGPTKEAAQIESSKAFAKTFMANNSIPTASFKIFSDYQAALDYVRAENKPLVIKADGLAAGKGVKVCKKTEEAEDFLKQVMVDKKFGDAGTKVVIEECLLGQEISVLALCDGKDFKLMLPSQDHKPIGDGDTGENTGGMGAFAPVPWVTAELMDLIERTIVIPTIQGLNDLNTPFVGCLYFGLMITDQGAMVLEYNVRFGDPETQPILSLLKSDLLEYMMACADGALASLPPLEWKEGYAVSVVLASGGYPGPCEKGYEIIGIESVLSDYPMADVFYAGVKAGDGKLLTSGGRVLAVNVVAFELVDAINTVYGAAKNIHFENMYFRKDIGKKAL